MASATALGKVLPNIFEGVLEVGAPPMRLESDEPPRPPAPPSEPTIPAYLAAKFLQQAVWICPVCGCYNSPTVSRCRQCGRRRTP